MGTFNPRLLAAAGFLLMVAARPASGEYLGILATDVTAVGIYTTVAVVNLSTVANDVSISFLDQTGSAVACTAKTLAGGETWVVNTGNGPASPVAGATDFEGAIVVTDTAGDQVLPWAALSGSAASSIDPTSVRLSFKQLTGRFNTGCTPPPPGSVCSEFPLPCDTPGKSIMLVKNVPGKTKLLWKWLKGSIVPEDLGDPTSDNNFVLCVYEDGVLAGTDYRIDAAGECGNKSCWKQTAKGFAYKNKVGNIDGIKALKLKTGFGKSTVVLQGAPDAELLPALPTLGDLDVQLVQTTNPTICYGAQFPPIVVKKNNGETYKAVFTSADGF